MLTKAHVTKRLHDLKAREEAGELPAWLAKVLRKGVRVAYKAEAKQRKAARRKVQTEKDAGRLERPERCEACGSAGPVEAHHRDHNEALEVHWLCKQCHIEADRGVEMSQTHRRSKAVAFREPWQSKSYRLNRQYGEMTTSVLSAAELEALKRKLHGGEQIAPVADYIYLAVVGIPLPSGPSIATQGVAA